MMLTRETVNQSRARLLSRFFHPKVQKRALNLQRRIARSCSIIGSRETCFLLQPPLDALKIRSITTLETGFSLPSSPNNLVPSSNMNSNPRFRFNFFLSRVEDYRYRRALRLFGLIGWIDSRIELENLRLSAERSYRASWVNRGKERMDRSFG